MKIVLDATRIAGGLDSKGPGEGTQIRRERVGMEIHGKISVFYGFGTLINRALDSLKTNRQNLIR